MERKPLTQVKLLPMHHVTHRTPLLPEALRGVALNTKDEEALIAALRRKPDPKFGVLDHNNKALDMDYLAKRILKKGSRQFEKPAIEILREVPPGHENGVLLTHAQVCRMFDVTSMTVYQWRKRFNLPVVILSGGKRPPVRYDEGVAKAWAALYNKKIMRNDYLEWC